MRRSVAVLFAAFSLALSVTSVIGGLASTAQAQSSCRNCIPVEIVSNPVGATVYFDSVSDSQRVGIAPIRWARLPRGNHTLIFQLEGHAEHRETVNVTSRLRRRTISVQLEAQSRLTVSQGNSESEGAAVRIDGQPVGNIPFESVVEPGRHLLQVGREGFVTFSQWVDLAGGQNLNVPVSLEAEAAATGSLLVAGDVSGATIFIDGVERGQTPAVIENIPEGERQVELRAPEALGLLPHSETVRIIAGERSRLIPQMLPVVTTGSLRVISNVAGAVVTLDGEAIGEAPATASSVTPGEHIVEVSAEGYQPTQQPVTIELGQQRVLSVGLEAIALAPGRVVVNANVANANVIVDGEERGPAPVVIDGLAAGTHAIIIRATGHHEVRQTCTTAPGEDCVFSADLQHVGTPVRVEANVDHAEFFIDGELMGPVPWEGNIPLGSHLVEVRAEGYETRDQQVNLEMTNDRRTFQVELEALPDSEAMAREQAAEERAELVRRATSFAADPIPNNLALVDFYLGWPYIGGARLSIGILEHFEAGVTIQTTGSGRITEFAGRFKAGWRAMRQISLGGQFTIGGGIGPTQGLTAAEEMLPTNAGDHPQNNFFMSLDLLATLHFGSVGSFTLDVGFDAYTDRYDWCGSDSNLLYSDAGCTGGGGAGPLASYDRQGSGRLRLEGFLEVLITQRWAFFTSFGGVVAGNPRRVMGDVYGLGKEEIMVYARAGATLKFGLMD